MENVLSYETHDVTDYYSNVRNPLKLQPDDGVNETNEQKKKNKKRAEYTRNQDNVENNVIDNNK